MPIKVICNLTGCNKEIKITPARFSKSKKGIFYCCAEHMYENKRKKLTCTNCNKTITIKKSSQNTKFCNKACSIEHKKKNAHKIQCSVCNKKVCRSKSQIANSKKHYCSLKCAGIGNSNSEIVKCTTCNKAIIKNRYKLKNTKFHFCSRECYTVNKPSKYKNTYKLRKIIQDRKRRRNLDKSYVKSRFKITGIEIPDEMIKLKKTIIKIKRQVYNINLK